jgi:hypothetical protein
MSLFSNSTARPGTQPILRIQIVFSLIFSPGNPWQNRVMCKVYYVAATFCGTKWVAMLNTQRQVLDNETEWQLNRTIDRLDAVPRT